MCSISVPFLVHMLHYVTTFLGVPTALVLNICYIDIADFPLEACLPACMHACLLACLPACFPVCLPVDFSNLSMHACMPACLHA
jgi:hypothetical protein